MKVLVFSDSHSYNYEMYEAIETHAPDAVIHLGDHAEDAKELRLAYQSLPVYAVRGNNDFERDVPQFIVMTLDGVRMYLTHGHRERVYGGGSGSVAQRALENSCRLAMFGHTHRYYMETEGGVVVYNPGSISLPRGGRPSYGILRIERGDFTIEPVYL